MESVEASSSTPPAEESHSQERQVHESCSICMSSEANNPSRIKACNHLFCYGCIQKWVHTKRGARCPLCGSAIFILVVAGVEEEVVRPASFDEDQEVDLACLDRDFCLSELENLARCVRTLTHQWRDHGYGRKRNGSLGVDTILQLLDSMSYTLRSTIDTLPTGGLFEPHTTLRTVQQLQEAVDQLPSFDASDSDTCEQAQAVLARIGDQLHYKQHRHAYDDDESESDDHHDYDDDDCTYDVSFRPPTSGRAPTHRNHRKRK